MLILQASNRTALGTDKCKDPEGSCREGNGKGKNRHERHMMDKAAKSMMKEQPAQRLSMLPIL
jgi:hypothetical protein